MKTAILAPCFLEEKDPIGNDRLERNGRYLKYYGSEELRGALGYERIFLVDNCSQKGSIAKLFISIGERLEDLSVSVTGDGKIENESRMGGMEFRGRSVTVFSYRDPLFRGKGPHDYPYCWRALYFAQRLIDRGYEKIIFLDSDGFILTNRLADFIRNTNKGWVSFLERHWKMPESSIHFLCADQFPLFEEYCRVPWEKRVGVMMEHALPFDLIEGRFNTQRFGERGAPEQDATMDYYGQAPLTVPLEFGRFA